MSKEHRVGQVGHGPDRLGADSRVGIGLGQVEELADDGRAARASECPDRVQSAANAQLSTADRLAQGRPPLEAQTLDGRLGLEPLEMTLRVEPRDPPRNVGPQGVGPEWDSWL